VKLARVFCDTSPVIFAEMFSSVVASRAIWV
jgi:hypothetical protein